ncbi:hypothetical protein NBRC116587_30390 [Pseudoteredinibacter isoporae]
MHLRIDASNQEAKLAEQAALEEIRRLEKVYSNYDSTSELMQIRNGLRSQLSTDMRTMVSLCQQWQEELPMAFSCRLGQVIDAWNQAEKHQQRPDRKVIRALARKALYSEYALSNGLIPSDFSWEFSAIAKGYIIDQAMAQARMAAPSAKALLLDIGGDIRQWQEDGSEAWPIRIADPNQLDDSQQHSLGSVHLNNQAIAYSGHKARHRQIGRRQFSHILQARDGWPRDFPNSAVVIASTATEADAIATALSTMDLDKALDWVEQNSTVEALLISEDGRQFPSSGWHPLNNKNAARNLASANIRFALPKIRSGNYRKPYVALWIEDEQRNVVKNLLLLGDSERWMSENSVWWRRQGRKTPALLDVMARPTRRSGEYQLQWSGRNDFGKSVATGQYQLIIEAAREHGGHEKISIPFELGKPIKHTEKGQKEIQFIELELRSPLVGKADIAAN